MVFLLLILFQCFYFFYPRQIFITSPENCIYSVPLGSCAFPFCSLSQAFLFDFSALNDTMLEYILLSPNNTYKPDDTTIENNTFFNEKAGFSIKLRGSNEGDCGNPYNSTNFNGFTMNFSNFQINFTLSYDFSLENMSILGENVGFQGNNSNTSYEISLYNTNFIGNSNFLYFSGVQALNLSVKNTTFQQNSSSFLLIEDILENSTISIENSFFYFSSINSYVFSIKASQNLVIFLYNTTFLNSSLIFQLYEIEAIVISACFFSNSFGNHENSIVSFDLMNISNKFSINSSFFSQFQDQSSRFSVSNVTVFSLENISFNQCQSTAPLFVLTYVSTFSLKSIEFIEFIDSPILLAESCESFMLDSLVFSKFYTSLVVFSLFDFGNFSFCSISNVDISNFQAKFADLFIIQSKFMIFISNLSISDSNISTLANMKSFSGQNFNITDFFLSNVSFSKGFLMSNGEVSFTQANIIVKNGVFFRISLPFFAQSDFLTSNLTFTNITFQESTFTLLITLNENNTLILDTVTFWGTTQNSPNLFISSTGNTIILTKFAFKNATYVQPDALNDQRLFSLSENNSFLMNDSVVSWPGLFFSFLEANYLNYFLIEGCFFKAFINNNPGGVFYLTQFNDFNVNSSFFEEIMSSSSGAVVLLDYMNNASITNNIFMDVRSDYKGGIMNLQNINIIFVIENLVLQSQGLLGAFAMLAFENKLLMISCVLAFGEATNHGGGVLLIEMNELYMRNLTFLNMSSKENGGAVYLSLNNRVSIVDVKINNSIAGLSGGFLYGISENSVVIINGSVDNVQSLLEGGAFYLSSGNVGSFFNISFTKIISTQFIAGIYVNCFNNITVSNTSLINSHGFKVKFGSILRLSNMKIQVANLDNMREDTQYYEVNCEDAEVSIENSIISGINAQFISSSYCNFSKLANVTFKDNYLNNSSVFISLTASEFNVSGMKFHSNSMVFLQGSHSTIFIRDASFESKGYLIISAQNCKVSVRNSVFEHDHSSDFPFTFSSYLLPFDILKKPAGFIFVTATHLEISNCQFQGGFAMKGAAILAQNYSRVRIFKILCILNWAIDSGGCVEFETNNLTPLNCDNQTFSYLRIKSSIFVRNQAKYGGSLFASQECRLETKKNWSFLDRTRFLSSKAFQGGAIFYSKFLNNEIQRSKFFNNFAQDFQDQLSKAGAVFLGCEAVDCNITNLTFDSIDLYNNQASIGGALFIETNPNSSNSDSVVYSGNKAFYSGNTIATFPQTIVFLSDSNDDFTKSLRLTGLVSGNDYTGLFCIIGLDYYQQRSFENYMINSNLTISDHSQITSPLLMSPVGNDRICSVGTLIEEPRANSQFHYILSYNSNSSEQSNLELELDFRACDVGERATDDFRCEECPVGQYSFDSNSSDKCLPCGDDDNFVCYGASYISPKPGYWRLNNLSDVFIRCPNPSSCLGYEPDPGTTFDMSKSTGVCREGYQGVLCAECQDGYGITNGNYCTECASLLYYLYLFGFLVLRIGLLVYSLHRAVTMCASSAAGFLKNEEIISSTIIKILMNHIQVLNIIISFPFEWNRSLFNSVMIATGVTPNISESYSWTCLFTAFGIEIHTHYLKIINLWLSLLFLLAICYGYYRNYLTRKIKFYLKFVKKTEQDILESTYVIILSICYADFITVALETFGCRDVGYAGFTDFRLVKDYSIRCWDETHEGWGDGLVVPYIFLFGLGFPVMIFFNLVYLYQKKELNNKDSMIKYGFFYLSYENNYFYWDFVILCRKIILSLINTFVVAVYYSIFSISVMFMFLILLIFLYLQVHCSPYLRKSLHQLNTLEKVSLISLTGTMFLAILSQQDAINYTLKGMLLAFSLCFNLIFMFYWLSIYYQSDIKKSLRRCFHIFVMILQYLINKIKVCFERRPINSVRFERRVGLTGMSVHGFLRSNDKRYLNFESEKEGQDVEKKDGIRKKLPSEIEVNDLDFEFFSLETYHKQKKKQMLHCPNSALSLVCKPVVLTEQSSIALKSSHLSVILKEESPSTKIFKANASRKLNKGRTFLDEDEDIKLENKVLKFKYDRQSKEVQDLKYQLKVNQEVSASFRNTIIEETNKRDLEEPYTMDRAMNELLNSSYYAAFLQKLKQDMNTENNFMALIQNQGVLLRTRNIEISFRNVLEKAETGGFWLKYQLNVKNLEARMLENLWVVYKQPELVENIFPEISCLNMVPAQIISQEITLGFKNLFLIPIVFDISYSLEGSQFVFSLVLPNSIWKFVQLLPKNSSEFADTWKRPCFLKFKGKRTQVSDFQYIKKLLFVEKIFQNCLMDLMPDQEFDDELMEKQYKKFGFFVKNSMSELTHLIVMKFARKSFNIQAKISEYAPTNEHAFIEFLISTINTAFSFLEIESS